VVWEGRRREASPYPDQAYLAAAIATGAMLAVYVGAAMASVAKGFVMLAVFAVTYGVLYLILQLEDYALLAGAILGFLALTIVMFATLRVDWSGDSTPHQGRAKPPVGLGGG
jgi:inner membrane protein